MTKFTEIEAERIETVANKLKAIAHPLRLAILGHLSEGEELTVTEIHDLLRIEQSTASHHLGILKDKNVLVSRRDGKNTYYKLKNNNLKKLVECLSVCACDD